MSKKSLVKKQRKGAVIINDDRVSGDSVSSERDYRPVRFSREYKSGCLGGIMYFVFILCVSIIIACLAWMCASDVLALNKDSFSVDVTLPQYIFTEKTVDVKDEDGNITGTKTVLSADMETVATTLKNSGLIQYKWLFEIFCKMSNADVKVEPGEYELKSSYDYRALIKHMQSGSGALLTVDITIPEGYTMLQIFNKFEENGVCSYDELLEAAANATFNYDFIDAERVGDPTRLEGFLFPDTYQFYVNMEASSAINRLLETYYYKQTADMIRQADQLGYSMYDIIKIASLIEREAAGEEDRALIASVIYNRLRSNMALGLDSSILYLYQNHEGEPDAAMIAEDTPYNLRIRNGLPPTPICNPGIAAINAALNPEYSNYLYFYYDAEAQQTKFFTNLGDFNNFVSSIGN